MAKKSTEADNVLASSLQENECFIRAQNAKISCMVAGFYMPTGLGLNRNVYFQVITTNLLTYISFNYFLIPSTYSLSSCLISLGQNYS